MKTHNIINLQKYLEVNEDLVSLLIQYQRNQLSEECSSALEAKIKSCKECGELFEEVKNFFDDDAAVLFEIRNPELIDDQLNKLKVLQSAFPLDENILGQDSDTDLNVLKSNSCNCC